MIVMKFLHLSLTQVVLVFTSVINVSTLVGKSFKNIQVKELVKICVSNLS